MVVGGGLEGAVVGVGLEVVVVGVVIEVVTAAPALASLVQQQAMATRRRHLSGSVESILANCGLLPKLILHTAGCATAKYNYNGTLVGTVGAALKGLIYT